MEIITQMGITPFTLLHILGVALGLGIATGMDFWLMQTVFRQKNITQTHVNVLETLSKFVSIALVLLWISGVGFLLFYAATTPEKLMNPKIWSKLTIVAALTVNGFIIHHYILPKMVSCIGQSLIAALPYRVLALFFASGAVSFVSWYFPFFYGTLPQLNFAFSFAEFSMVYAAIVGVAVLGGLSLLGFLYASHTQRLMSVYVAKTPNVCALKVSKELNSVVHDIVQLRRQSKVA